MPPLLSTRGLAKSFGQTQALRDVSITIEPGKVYTVLGENGSGKSTLVKILSGIIPADTGDIFIGERIVTPSAPADMIAHGISVVLQEVLIAPNRSGLENVLIGRDSPWRLHQSPRKRREEGAAWIEKLSIRSIDLDRPAGDLALKEQQVLVIARGFIARPKILILDEITAALDLADRDKVFAAISNFCADGGAVIFVSHRMPEIMELSDVVFIMHNGTNIAEISGDNINPETLLACLTQEEAYG